MHKHNKNGDWEAMAGKGVQWAPPRPDDLLVGIDDTDNLDSRGTGFRARELVRLLSDSGTARAKGVTRHQLFVHPEIRYTSHNSAACICLADAPADAVIALCRDYLVRHSAEGSDPGLCVARRACVAALVQRFGVSAKDTVLQKRQATALAASHELVLEELAGDGGGVIGALASVALHTLGSDGRFLWLKGLRERAGQTLAVDELRGELALSIATRDGFAVESSNDHVALGDRPRAIFRNHRPLLLVEANDAAEDACWRVVPRDLVKDD